MTFDEKVVVVKVLVWVNLGLVCLGRKVCLGLG